MVIDIFGLDELGIDILGYHRLFTIKCFYVSSAFHQNNLVWISDFLVLVVYHKIRLYLQLKSFKFIIFLLKNYLPST
jgi:hypothetical protein